MCLIPRIFSTPARSASDKNNTALLHQACKKGGFLIVYVKIKLFSFSLVTAVFCGAFKELYATAATLQIFHSGYLRGPLHVIVVHRVMVAFDVNCACESCLKQDCEDIRPVGVSETGSSVPCIRVNAMCAVFANYIPRNSCVLSVNVDYFFCPFAELGNRIDQGAELMSRLPFKSESITGNCVEHKLPSGGRKSNVFGVSVPTVAAVFEADLHSVSLSQLCERFKGFLKQGNVVGNAFCGIGTG